MERNSLLKPYTLYPKHTHLRWTKRIIQRGTTYEFATSDLPPVFPIYNRYPARTVIKAHHHRFLEISLILSGSGEAVIDGTAVSLARGSLILINHLQEHAETFRSKLAEKLILAFLPSAIETALDLSVSNGIMRAFSLTEPFFRGDRAVHAVSLDEAALTRVARSWCTLIHAYNEGASADAVTGHLRSLMHFIIAEHGGAREQNASPIAPALDHLSMNMRAPDIAQAIAATGLSKSHFYKRFTREVGMPVEKYITKLRISKASTLLRTTAFSAARIARELGFYDVSHFHRTFKRETGHTIAEHRRQ